MADVNYVSPSSLLPKTDTVPLPAFMLGNQYADQMRDYKDQLSLQNVVSGMGAQKQRGQLEDYFSTRDSANTAANAENKAKAATIGDLLTGQSKQALAKGRLDMGTVDSDIATRMAENLAKQGTAGLTNLRTGIKLAQHAAGLQGPQSAAEIAQIGKQYGLPDGMVQRIIQNPQKMQEFLMSIDDKVQGKILEDTNAHNLTNKGNMDVARERSRSAKEVALINAEKAAQLAQYRAQFGQTFEKLGAAALARVQAARAKGQQPDPTDVETAQFASQLLTSLRTGGIQQQQAGVASATQGAIPAPAGVAPPAVPGSAPSKKLAPEAVSKWKSDAKAANPNMTDAEIEAEGRKRGYF